MDWIENAANGECGFMSQIDIIPAPEICVPTIPPSKWQREHEEFLRLLPALLATHRGKFVAVHDGKVVGSGEDQTEVALQAYSEWGYVPIFVGLVTDSPPPFVRIASPRQPRTNGA
jgi:hypothetical protein